MMQSGRWAEFGDAVYRRRKQLELTQEKVAAKGGPSVASLRSIETAHRSGYRASTYTALEKVLEWKHGTCRSIVAGTAGSDPSTWVVQPRPYAGTVQLPRRACEDRIGQIRRLRGWTYEQVSVACRRLGAQEMTAALVEEIETHTRGHLDIGEVMLLAYALDVAPIHIMAPLEPLTDSDLHLIQIGPERWLKTHRYRDWIRGGYAPWGDIDPAWYHGQVPTADWHAPALSDGEIADQSRGVREHRRLVSAFLESEVHPDYSDENEKLNRDLRGV